MTMGDKEKVQRYGWSEIDKQGTFKMMKVADLQVDHLYQRNERPVGVTNITRHFSWSYFGALSVRIRDDGRAFVTDGQQRLSAAKNRGIEEVPCIVFGGGTVKNEALDFAGINTGRAGVRAADRFKAAAIGEKEPELTISRWLEENGFAVSDHSGGSSVSFPIHLLRTWKIDERSCRRALLAQRELNEPLRDVMNGAVHGGIWWLYRRGVDVLDHKDKIVNRGGSATIHGVARSMTTEIGVAARRDDPVMAAAILRIINHGRRNKIRVSSEI